MCGVLQPSKLSIYSPHMELLTNFSPCVEVSISWTVMARGNTEEVDGIVESGDLRGTIVGRGIVG